MHSAQRSGSVHPVPSCDVFVGDVSNDTKFWPIAFDNTKSYLPAFKNPKFGSNSFHSRTTSSTLETFCKEIG